MKPGRVARHTRCAAHSVSARSHATPAFRLGQTAAESAAWVNVRHPIRGRRELVSEWGALGWSPRAGVGGVTRRRRAHAPTRYGRRRDRCRPWPGCHSLRLGGISRCRVDRLECADPVLFDAPRDTHKLASKLASRHRRRSRNPLIPMARREGFAIRLRRIALRGLRPLREPPTRFEA
jgi:hypothetical protein